MPLKHEKNQKKKGGPPPFPATHLGNYFIEVKLGQIVLTDWLELALM